PAAALRAPAKPCRVATLPGSPCGGDLLPAEAGQSGPRPAMRAPRPEGAWSGADAGRRPPRDPPRPV
ncbi:hypothetical protein, partial [Roseivivax sp. CAU 1761]